MFQDFERQLAEERKRNLEKEERKREAERLQERGGWNVLEKDAGSDDSMDVDNPDGTDNGTVILDEEPVAGSGMGAALKLAMSKGYLEKEETKRITVSKSGQELQAQRYTIEDKVVYVSPPSLVNLCLFASLQRVLEFNWILSFQWSPFQCIRFANDSQKNSNHPM